MTSSLQQPTTDRELERLKIRVTALEKALGRLVELYRPEELFDFPGPIYASESDRYRPSSTTTIADVLMTLLEAGTTDTVVEMLKNGSSVDSFTIPANTRSLLIAVSQTYTNGDELSFAVETAGNGARGLLVAARHRV